MKFAVEQSEGNHKAAYGQVHKAGCRDLKDAEVFEAEPTYEAVQAGAEDLMNWGEGETYTYAMAPCVTKALKEDA